MKRYFLHLACAVALCGIPLSGSASETEVPDIPDQWTLEQAVGYALKNNPQTDIATQRLGAARAATRSAHTYNHPSVSLVTEYSQTDTPMYSFGNILNQGAFDNTIDFNDPGRTDDLLVKAQVQYRLYNGGQTHSAIEAAQAKTNAAEKEIEIVHQQLAFEVVRSYHAILQAKEMLQVRRSAIEAISASVDVGRARYNAGDLLKEDLLNLELQKVRAIENEIRANQQHQLSQKIFWNLLGFEDTSEKQLPEPGGKQVLPTDLSFEDRRELQAIKHVIDAAAARLEQARGSGKPTVDAFAHYQFDYGTVLDESGDSWLAGVRMNYTLYNGNRTSHESATAQSRLRAARAEEEKLRLALSLELQQALIMHRQSLEKLQVTEKMVEVAEESAKLSRLRFQEGVILASDLIDTEMRLTDAHARHASAKAENSIAIANLRKTAGLDQF